MGYVGQMTMDRIEIQRGEMTGIQPTDHSFHLWYTVCYWDITGTVIFFRVVVKNWCYVPSRGKFGFQNNENIFKKRWNGLSLWCGLKIWGLKYPV